MTNFRQKEYLLNTGWRQLISGHSSFGWKDPQGGSAMSLSMAVATQNLRDNNTVVSAKETDIHISKDESELKEPVTETPGLEEIETKKKRKKKNTVSED